MVLDRFSYILSKEMRRQMILEVSNDWILLLGVVESLGFWVQHSKLGVLGEF